jgi:hypothetical protein
LQQAAFSAQLIGSDCFMLQSEGNIQDADIRTHVATCGKCQARVARQHGDGSAR